MTTEAPRRTMRRRVPWWLWVIGVFVVAVATVALLGGFNDVPVEKLPTIALGTTEPGNEIDATVTGSYLTTSAPVTGNEVDEGKVDLVVEATLLNVTDSASIFATSLVRVYVDGVLDPYQDDPKRVIDMRDGGQLGFLQPGLPTKVAYIWELDSSRIANGDDLIVGIFEEHHVDGDPLFDDAKSAPAPVVRIVTKVGEE